MPNTPIFLFLTLGIPLLNRKAAKLHFVTFLKNPGMALTSATIHLEKSMRSCGTARLQILTGSIALDTLNLLCKFFCSTM